MIYIDTTRAVEVRIYHNVAEDSDGRRTGWFGYKNEDPIVHVATWWTTTVDNDNAVLSKAFEIFNVGDDPEFGPVNPVALVYRERKNRSLSVGDVVQVEGSFYACESVGWKRIHEVHINKVRDYSHGTTPIPMSEVR